MPINKLFGGSFALTAQALDVRMARQGLIQANIANIDTPGYTVRDFSFKDVMGRLQNGAPALRRTHEAHIALNPITAATESYSSGEPRPVDLDEEMLKLSENQLLYQIATRIMTKKLEGMRYAIDEGGK